MLLFNGSLHNPNDNRDSFYGMVYNYVLEQCKENGIEVTEIDLSKNNLPFLDPFNIEKDENIELALESFTSEDTQIWLAPLYHGSIPGVMKNALDWLELTSRDDIPYLSNKKIGLIGISDGSFAVQGINTMISVAHTLRAWVLPYSIPINKQEALFRDQDQLAEHYRTKIDLMIQLLKEEGA